MKTKIKVYSILIFISLLGASSLLKSEPIDLSMNIPPCKYTGEIFFPEKYYDLASRHQEFSWVFKIKPEDAVVYGTGFEGIEGSGFYSRYEFLKLDINNDGICDWVLTYSNPPLSIVSQEVSTINTFYISNGTTWSRFGSTTQQGNYFDATAEMNHSKELEFSFFSQPPGVLYDRKSKTVYLIGTHLTNSPYPHSLAAKTNRFGYRIYHWDNEKNTLQDLNKWEPHSIASQVYGFFKKNGALNPSAPAPEEKISLFEDHVEKLEIKEICRPVGTRSIPLGLQEICKKQKLK